MKLLTFALLMTVLSTTALAGPTKCRIVTSISKSAVLDKGYQPIDVMDAQEGDYLEYVQILATDTFHFLDSSYAKITYEQVIERKTRAGSEIIYAKEHSERVKGGYLTYVKDYQIDEALNVERAKKLPSCRKISKR